jgi:GNAT superfamily N-acetyltransferase
MNITFRQYSDPADYKLIDNFLIEHYQQGNQDGNWIEPAWEYGHSHPLLDKSSLGKIGIWQDGNEIVGVTHYEWQLGEAFFQFHPAYRHLRKDMLDYAEQSLYGTSKNGKRFLQVYINNYDDEFQTLVISRGYDKDENSVRQMLQFTIPYPFPAITLPDGFCLKSLADEPDWAKVHRVLWRGFDHEGEPPPGEEELESRRSMFDSPNGRRDLKIVVQAPNGDFASFCGMFYEPNGKFAYVEPVATDPDYRRMGLGKAVVLEGIHRCAALGATVTFVGNDLPIYQAVGFRKIYENECWVKYFDN